MHLKILKFKNISKKILLKNILNKTSRSVKILWKREKLLFLSYYDIAVSIQMFQITIAYSKFLAVLSLNNKIIKLDNIIYYYLLLWYCRY